MMNTKKKTTSTTLNGTKKRMKKKIVNGKEVPERYKVNGLLKKNVELPKTSNGQFTQDHWPLHISHQFTFCRFYLWSFIRDVYALMWVCVYIFFHFLFLLLARWPLVNVYIFSVSNLFHISHKILWLKLYEAGTLSRSLVVFVSFSYLNASLFSVSLSLSISLYCFAHPFHVFRSLSLLQQHRLSWVVNPALTILAFRKLIITGLCYEIWIETNVQNQKPIRMECERERNENERRKKKKSSSVRVKSLPHCLLVAKRAGERAHLAFV